MKRLSLILLIILIASCLGSGVCSIAFAAAETIYTTVTDDLGKDESFDVKQIQKDAAEQGNPEMYVFQIAESNAGELFIYVYQQSESKYTASEIRISKFIGDNLAPKDYKLTLLSRNGTLHKYKVNDFAVLFDSVRNYLIVQIARPWDNNLGDTLENKNEVNTVAYAVNKLFSAETVDGAVKYTVKQNDSIVITSKYVGNLRYYDGGTWGHKYYTSSHYVAFSTDRRIDEIYEVDVSYVVKDYGLVDDLAYKNWDTANKQFFEQNSSSNTVTLKSEQYAQNNNIWTSKLHTWKRIQSVTEFIKSEKFADASVLEQLEGKQWVLRFAETNITRTNLGLAGYNYSLSEVSDVTILRLHFLSYGKVFNLGVVDNKQSGSSVTKPDSPPNGLDGLLDRLRYVLDRIETFFAWLGEHWWVIVVGVIVIAIIAALIAGIIKFGARVAFKVLGTVLWWILKIIFYIVTLPVWLIIWGVRAIKKNKQ